MEVEIELIDVYVSGMFYLNSCGGEGGGLYNTIANFNT